MVSYLQVADLVPRSNVHDVRDRGRSPHTAQPQDRLQGQLRPVDGEVDVGTRAGCPFGPGTQTRRRAEFPATLPPSQQALPRRFGDPVRHGDSPAGRNLGAPKGLQPVSEAGSRSDLEALERLCCSIPSSQCRLISFGHANIPRTPPTHPSGGETTARGPRARVHTCGLIAR
jgi:hypothetical protein